MSSWENLISLDLSGTAVDDADVQLIGTGSMGDTGGRCTSCGPAVVRPQYAASSQHALPPPPAGVACDNLRTLNLSACCRIKEGLLPRSSAVLVRQPGPSR